MLAAAFARQPRRPMPTPPLRRRLIAQTLGATLLLVLAVPAVAASSSDIVTAYLDAMSRQDRAAVAAVIADDAVFEYPFDKSGRTEAGAWRVFVGREAVLTGYVDNAFRRMAKIGFVDREITRSSDGRRVFVETLGDMDLGGKPYRNRYVLRFDLKGGRITRMKEYMNPVTGAIAAGITTGAEVARK